MDFREMQARARSVRSRYAEVGAATDELETVLSGD